MSTNDQKQTDEVTPQWLRAHAQVLRELAIEFDQAAADTDKRGDSGLPIGIASFETATWVRLIAFARTVDRKNKAANIATIKQEVRSRRTRRKKDSDGS